MSFLDRSRKPITPLVFRPSRGRPASFGRSFHDAYMEETRIRGAQAAFVAMTDAIRKEAERIDARGGEGAKAAGPLISRMARGIGQGDALVDFFEAPENLSPEERDYFTKAVEQWDAISTAAGGRPLRDVWGGVKTELEGIERDVRRAGHRPGSLGSMAGGFAGAVAGTMHPTYNTLNFFTLGLGGFGRTIAGRVATEAGIGASVESVNQFFARNAVERAVGRNPTAADAAQEILFAGAGAGAFRLAGEGAVAGYQAVRRRLGRRDDETDAPYGTSPAARRAQQEDLQETVDQLTAGADPRAGTFGSSVSQEQALAAAEFNDPGLFETLNDLKARVAELEARTAGWKELDAIVASGDPDIGALKAHPTLAKAIADMEAIPDTSAAPGYLSDGWKASQTYNPLDGSGRPIQGWYEAANHAYVNAERYAGDGGVVYDVRMATIVVGPPAVGKSTIAEKLAARTGSMLIDSDDVKKMIPAYGKGEGAAAVHQESFDIADAVLASALNQGANVVLPRVGAGSPASITKLVDRLQAKGYDVRLVAVDTDPAEAWRRMLNRFRETGRLIEPDYMKDALAGSGKGFELAKGKVNEWFRVDNNGPAPKVADASDIDFGKFLFEQDSAPDAGGGGAISGQAASLFGGPEVGKPGVGTAADPLTVLKAKLATQQKLADRAVLKAQKALAGPKKPLSPAGAEAKADQIVAADPVLAKKIKADIDKVVAADTAKLKKMVGPDGDEVVELTGAKLSGRVLADGPTEDGSPYVTVQKLLDDLEDDKLVAQATAACSVNAASAAEEADKLAAKTAQAAEQEKLAKLAAAQKAKQAEMKAASAAKKKAEQAKKAQVAAAQAAKKKLAMQHAAALKEAEAKAWLEDVTGAKVVGKTVTPVGEEAFELDNGVIWKTGDKPPAKTAAKLAAETAEKGYYQKMTNGGTIVGEVYDPKLGKIVWKTATGLTVEKGMFTPPTAPPSQTFTAPPATNMSNLLAAHKAAYDTAVKTAQAAPKQLTNLPPSGWKAFEDANNLLPEDQKVWLHGTKDMTNLMNQGFGPTKGNNQKGVFLADVIPVNATYAGYGDNGILKVSLAGMKPLISVDAGGKRYDDIPVAKVEAAIDAAPNLTPAQKQLAKDKAAEVSNGSGTIRLSAIGRALEKAGLDADMYEITNVRDSVDGGNLMANVRVVLKPENLQIIGKLGLGAAMLASGAAVYGEDEREYLNA